VKSLRRDERDLMSSAPEVFTTRVARSRDSRNARGLD